MGIFDKGFQNLTSLIGDDLFGGSAGGTEQATLQLPEQRDFLVNLLGQLGGLTQQGLTPINFPSAGASQLQQSAFGGFGGLGQLGQQGFGIAGQQLAQFDPNLGGQFLGQAGGALTQGLQGLDPQRILDALEPGRRLALNTFEQDIVPFLGERFGATSGASGAFNKQLAESGANLSLGLGAQAAQFLGQGALQAPGIQFQGANIAGNLAQLPGQLAGQGLDFARQGGNLFSQLLNAGGIQRGITSDQLAAQTQTQLDPRNLLAQFAALGLGTQGFENIITPPGPSPISQIAQIAGAAAPFFI